VTNLRTILQDFVRWAWIIHVLLVFFMVLAWRVFDWFMALKDPTATQAGVLGLVIGTLPVLGTIYTSAVARIPPPREAP
jgi:hypothetical protein